MRRTRSRSKNILDENLEAMAESNLLKKLNAQGISRSDLTDEKFNELLEYETEIIINDGKKVGAGIGVGIALSILSGGLL